MVFIRTDGNHKIATGHIVRCLSIARAFVTRFGNNARNQIHFLLSDDESANCLNHFFDCENEFEYTVLDNTSYKDMINELPQLLALATIPSCSASTCSNDIDSPYLLIDSYYLSESYILTLNKHYKIIYIDDLRAFDYQVEYIINYDIIPDSYTETTYLSSYKNAKHILLGGSYAPLRNQFWITLPTNTMPEGYTCILISTGGSDQYHMTTKLLTKLLQEFPDGYHFKLLLGNMNSDREYLRQVSLQHNNSLSTEPNSTPSIVSTHENITQMAALMSSCQLALCAAGTTLYELCATGVPTASFIIADNQIPSATAFSNTGILPCIGDVRISESTVIDNAVCWIKEMSETDLSNISTKLVTLVDGCGALNIVDKIFG